MTKCPSCAGKGKYVGLNSLEDPCLQCMGLGETSPLVEVMLDVLEYGASLLEKGGDPYILTADSEVEALVGWTVFNSKNLTDPENATKHFPCHLNYIRSFVDSGKVGRPFINLLKKGSGRADLAMKLLDICRLSTQKQRSQALADLLRV